MSPFIGKILSAILYGICTFLAVFIVGIILVQVPQAVEIGQLLKKWAPLIGLLAGLVAYFSGAKPLFHS